MYYGEYHIAIDEKGRFSVPVSLRALMEAQGHETWFMTRGFDGAVFLFTNAMWEKLVEQGAGTPLDPRRLDFRRLFVGSMGKSRLDRQGRLFVPTHLRAYAGVEREGVLIGVGDHFELWNEQGWLAFQERQAQEYKRMAAELFGARPERATEPEGNGQ